MKERIFKYPKSQKKLAIIKWRQGTHRKIQDSKGNYKDDMLEVSTFFPPTSYMLLK